MMFPFLVRIPSTVTVEVNHGVVVCHGPGYFQTADRWDCRIQSGKRTSHWNGGTWGWSVIVDNDSDLARRLDDALAEHLTQESA